MRDDILMTIFGGGTLDWEMLDKCNYDFEDIYNFSQMFSSLGNDMDFNCILLGAIDLYRDNIDKSIREKIKETESELKGLEDYSDMYNGDIDDEYVGKIIRLRKQLEDLNGLYTTDDIEYNTNYLDTSMWFVNDEVKELYKKYLSKEIEEENDKIGFVSLDLD